MHVVFVHQNFPAQFGHLARELTRRYGYRTTFLSETPAGEVDGIRKIRYRVVGGATERTHYFSRTFENGIWRAAAVYDALKPLASSLRPDVIVGHSGFGSTLFLRELFPDIPIVNYFEFFYYPRDSDIDFRGGWQPLENQRLRTYSRNAMTMLDLENCDAGYTPTRYQWELFPAAYRPKIRIIHDGIDTSFWKPVDAGDRAVAGHTFPDDAKLVTFVARGFESVRGFDVFMAVAKRICDVEPGVMFAVVGTDRGAYGSDADRVVESTFKEHVLRTDDYDLDRIIFLGQIDRTSLVRLFAMSDLHIYLTVPFVLSWSALNAMSCGCVVLGSDTGPVREVIDHERNGLLCDFHDVDALTDTALRVLRQPAAYVGLGRAARETVEHLCSVDVVLPKFASFYEDVTSTPRPVSNLRK